MISPRDARERKAKLARKQREADQPGRSEPLSIEQQAEMLVIEGERGLVPSASRLNLAHQVYTSRLTKQLECTCEDFLYHAPKAGYKCRHIEAFEMHKSRIDDAPADRCEWCALVLSGYPAPYANGYHHIPARSRNDCARHAALQNELSRGIDQSPIDADLRPLFQQIAFEGQQIAQECKKAA